MLSVARHTRCMRYYTLKEEGLFSTRRMTILELAAYIELSISQFEYIKLDIFQNIKIQNILVIYIHLITSNWLH